MLYAVQTQKSPDQVGKGLEEAVSRHRFGVLAVHDLTASMAKHGLTFNRACRVYAVCQPQRAKQVLEANTAIATALPCRIAVYEDGGRTTLAMLKPTALLGLFREPGLEEIGREIERDLVAIMDEAAQST